MILIADIGGSKGDWVLLSAQREDIETYKTTGFHPLTSPIEQLDKLLDSLSLGSGASEILKVYYYGAACSLITCKKLVESKLQSYFIKAKIEVDGDILGAARGLCGKSEGVVAILGTGSSSCHYDGNRIIDQVPSLGYILGDEGGGAHLGKLFLKSYYYRELGNEINQLAENAFDLDRNRILSIINNNQYKEASNSFLASFVSFLHINKSKPGIKNIIDSSLSQFIKGHLLKYVGIDSTPIYFVGSVAWYFEDELRQIMKENGLSFSGIVQHPLEKIKIYHSTYG